MKKNTFTTVNLCYIGVMTAIAVVLSFMLKIPMSFLAPWLKLDLSFVPMMLTGFALGPVAGLCVLLGFCFMMPAVLIYQKVHTRKGALIGMVTGTLCLIVGGVLSNLYILFPLYFGADYAADLAKMGFESVFNCILVAVVPFNVIKGVVISIVTFLLYKRLSKLLHKLAGKKA